MIYENLLLSRVFFISSVPGKHFEPVWGQSYMKSILKSHACLPFGTPSDWPLISQCSSLGSFNINENDWLISEFVKNLSVSTPGNTIQSPIPFNLVRYIFKNISFE